MQLLDLTHFKIIKHSCHLMEVFALKKKKKILEFNYSGCDTFYDKMFAILFWC